jgi:pimeloyl-ACP methyl ester carboxylesterase/thiamine pyrophosphate-dependent acetolactate synthase large subunit-like protein
MHAELIELSTGARVFLAWKGSAGELVLFLHAVGGDHTSWYHQMEGLADRYTVAAYDLRGHGRSQFDVEDTIVREAVSIGAFAKDSIAIIEQLGFRRAHLVGAALGGVIALEIFKRRSDIVQSLTLAHSWAYHPDAESRIHAMGEQLYTRPLAELAQTAAPALFAPNVPRSLVQRAVEIEGAKNKHVYLASWTASYQNDYRRMLELIDVPLLLVGGTLDRTAPTDPLLTSIQSAVPTAQLVNIEGAGHYSQLDHPQELTRALRAHLLRSRAAETQRLALPERTKMSLDGSLASLLARRGVTVADSVALAQGGWAISGRLHAVDAERSVDVPPQVPLLRLVDGGPSSESLETTVDRAVAIALSEPLGAIDITAGNANGPIEIHAESRHQPHAPTEPSDDAIERAARAIAAAVRPVVITGALGRHRGGPEALVQLAQRHAIPVIEHERTFFNFPTRHAMHLGFNATAVAKLADVVIAIESAAPNVEHHPTVISIAMNPLGHAGAASDISLAGHPALTLRRITSCLDKSRPDREKLAARYNLYASEHRRGLQQAQTRAIADAGRAGISRLFFTYCLGEAIGDDAVLWNESGVEPHLVKRRLPDSWFTVPSAFEASLGAHLAAPEMIHIALLRERAYDMAVHQLALARKAPVAVIVLNTSGADHARNAEASGVAALRADTPRNLPAALQQTIDLARRKQHVLLDVVCEGER